MYLFFCKKIILACDQLEDVVGHKIVCISFSVQFVQMADGVLIALRSVVSVPITIQTPVNGRALHAGKMMECVPKAASLALVALGVTDVSIGACIEHKECSFPVHAVNSTRLLLDS